MIDRLKRLARSASPLLAGLLAGIALIAVVSPRLAVLLFVAWTVAVAVRHDGDTGTWSTLYVVFLIILAILVLLLAGLGLLHRLISG
ncbi:hypothetical protein M0208_13440 [Sphingomonas sp. SUN019]|uniref:hypothetical protein n=1 Tax=Sphingomonas sp. SUN019 TaxID=2937788 RepID=UPI0021647B64|nr:hypothetical protein [Sphingomonas sp. SUN019]UVO51457.1 hypothetical protein M0208_13440 [Sphingomonas sp. SUN019]